MFAVVANGMQAICKTQRRLESIIAFYPYPKFCKCSTEEEARMWLRNNSRGIYGIEFKSYGNTASEGYAIAEYYIWDNSIYYNINTKHLGYIKVFPTDDIKMESRQELLKIKVCNVMLDDSSISSHCIAIRKLLRLLGGIIDVEIIVPDISIYLAATKYTGRSVYINGLRRDIVNRLGEVSFTIKEGR